MYTYALGVGVKRVERFIMMKTIEFRKITH